MTDIENYLNDDANYQAQAVLAFVRAKKEIILEDLYDRDYEDDYKGYLRVGRFENYREQGYVFILGDYLHHQKNYAVYEHRNSDSIIVLINELATFNTPTIDQMWGGREDKYDYDKSFKYGDILGCSDWLIKDMRETIKKWEEENNDNEEE